MERDQLLRLWIDQVKFAPPVAISRQLLERGLAYALQEHQFGALSNRLRKELQKIGRSGDERNAGRAKIAQSQTKPNGSQSKVPSDARVARVGTTPKHELWDRETGL